MMTIEMPLLVDHGLLRIATGEVGLPAGQAAETNGALPGRHPAGQAVAILRHFGCPLGGGMPFLRAAGPSSSAGLAQSAARGKQMDIAAEIGSGSVPVMCPEIRQGRPGETLRRRLATS